MVNSAIIFGVTGQDGSYLAELLLSKGYNVIGVSRRTSLPNDLRIKHLLAKYRDPEKFRLVCGDVTDASCVQRIIRDAGGASQFHTIEVYNLAAQSHVGVSFEQPSLTWAVTAGGALNILEAIRGAAGSKYHRFYQASSSEMFGSRVTGPYYDIRDGEQRDELSSLTGRIFNHFQDERTPMCPNSPYAIAKLAAHNLVDVYRKAYGIHASSGILFNHESERRGEEFVTRKISKYVAALDHQQPDWHDSGAVEKLCLGNVDARRDWGYAPDYVEAMWLMLQQTEPDDYVIATGETHSVREFVEAAFECVGITREHAWGFIHTDIPDFKRPVEVPYLRGIANKALVALGWKPKTTFAELVAKMVNYDRQQLKAAV